MLIVLGITIDGRKIPLGFEQTVTENERVAAQCLRKLIDRGLRFDQGLLVDPGRRQGTMQRGVGGSSQDRVTESSAASGTNARTCSPIWPNPIRSA